MVDEPAPPHPCSRIGWATIIFGVVGVLRWIPEAIGMSYSVDANYVSVVAFESVLALAAIFCGIGLKRRRHWSWQPTSMTWGSLVGPPLLIGPLLLQKYLNLDYDFRNAVTIMHRIAFTAATILAAPYGLWWMLRRPLTERPATWLVWGCFGVGLSVGLAGAALTVSMVH